MADNTAMMNSNAIAKTCCIQESENLTVTIIITIRFASNIKIISARFLKVVVSPHIVSEQQLAT